MYPQGKGTFWFALASLVTAQTSRVVCDVFVEMLRRRNGRDGSRSQSLTHSCLSHLGFLEILAFVIAMCATHCRYRLTAQTRGLILTKWGYLSWKWTVLKSEVLRERKGRSNGTFFPLSLGFVSIEYNLSRGLTKDTTILCCVQFRFRLMLQVSS